MRRPIRCRECHAPLNAKAARRRDDLATLCVTCSAGKLLAERLKARRIAAGLVVKELAVTAGVSEATINGIEHMRTTPRPETVAKLTRALGAL
jgi:DNA-binding XRE family transcriptional regulator